MSTLSSIILGVVVLLILWLITVYNGLVRLNNKTKEAWSDILVQLKRRYDLIPNLVNTVKGYAAHESGLFEKVTQARSVAMGAKNPAEVATAENNLNGVLKSLFAVAENYPDLKANTNFLSLQEELSGTENKIEASRRFYNGNVRDFNTKIEVFPTNLIAGMLKFVKYEFFNATEEEQKNVNVQF